MLLHWKRKAVFWFWQYSAACTLRWDPAGVISRVSCLLPPPERQTLCLPVCPQNASLFGTHEWALGLQSWQLYHVWTVLRCFPEVLLNTYAFLSCIWGGVLQPYLSPAVADLLSLPFFIFGWVLEIKSRVLGLCCFCSDRNQTGKLSAEWVVWFTLPDVYDYIWYYLRPSQAFSSKGTHRFLAVSCRQDVCWINRKAENTEFCSSSLTGDAKYART